MEVWGLGKLEKPKTTSGGPPSLDVNPPRPRPPPLATEESAIERHHVYSINRTTTITSPSSCVTTVHCANWLKDIFDGLIDDRGRSGKTPESFSTGGRCERITVNGKDVRVWTGRLTTRKPEFVRVGIT